MDELLLVLYITFNGITVTVNEPGGLDAEALGLPEHIARVLEVQPCEMRGAAVSVAIENASAVIYGTTVDVDWECLVPTPGPVERPEVSGDVILTAPAERDLERVGELHEHPVEPIPGSMEFSR